MSILKAARLAYTLIRGTDLVRAFGRHLHHFLRQALRHTALALRRRTSPLTPGEAVRRTDHGLQLLEFRGREIQVRADAQQQAAFGGVHHAIGIRRLYQELQEHAQQIAPPETFAFELRQHVVQGKVGALAFVEEAYRRLLQHRIETEPSHHAPRDLNLVLAYAAVDLGNVPHHRGGRGGKGRLYALLFARLVAVREMQLIFIGLAVEPVTERGSDQRAERTAQDEAHGAAEGRPPPTHVTPLRLAPRAWRLCSTATACIQAPLST